MTQTKIHAERLRRIQSVLRSCVALAIAIAALATPLTGCTSVKPQLKAVKLSSEDKDAIARLMAYNCFIDYDSRKPENENTAIFLTIGQMCGCWKMYVNDQDEEKRKDYYKWKKTHIRANYILTRFIIILRVKFLKVMQ